jgi:hypothetical protein
VALPHTTRSITPASIKHGLCQVVSQVQLFICSELAAAACHSVQHTDQVAAVDSQVVHTLLHHHKFSQSSLVKQVVAYSVFSCLQTVTAQLLLTEVADVRVRVTEQAKHLTVVVVLAVVVQPFVFLDHLLIW